MSKLDISLIFAACFAIPLTVYSLTIGSSSTPPRLSLGNVLLISASLAAFSVSAYVIVKKRKRKKGNRECGGGGGGIGSTEDLWNEDKYFPEQRDEDDDGEQDRVDDEKKKIINKGQIPPISLAVTPVQPDLNPVHDESWDFDYEEEKRNRRISISLERIPFETRYKSLQILRTDSDMDLSSAYRKTSEPWEIYSRYRNYRLMSSGEENAALVHHSQQRKRSKSKCEHKQQLMVNTRKSKLNRVRKVTKANILTNPEISTTSSTEADFMRNSTKSVVASKRKRKRLKRKEVAGGQSVPKINNNKRHRDDEESATNVSDAKFEQILSSLRNLDIQ